MTTTSSTHPAHESFRRRHDYPEGTLAVTVLIGALGLAWFALYVWYFVNQAYSP